MKTSMFTPLVFGVATALTLGTVSAAQATEPASDAVLTVSSPAVISLPASDGVRDTTQVIVTSDADTTGVPRIYSPEGALVAELAPLDLATVERRASLVVDVSLTTRPGRYRLEVTPASGAPVSTDLVVGSGAPVDVSLSLNPRSIWSWSKAKVNTSTATVAAVDETGLRVPFTGVVTAVRGAKSSTLKVASATGAPAKATVSGVKLGTGTAKVTFTAKAAGKTRSTSTNLTVKDVAITATAVSASARTIYPVKDGYLDATKISVSSNTSTAEAVTAQGTVTILRGTKTVRSWKLSSSKSWNVTWDGKVGGKVVPGTYTVKVQIKGPQGATKSATTTVVVKTGKLVEKTVKKTYKTSSVLKTYTPLDEYQDGYCDYDEVTFACIGFDGYYGDDSVSLISEGTTGVPKQVRDSYGFGGVKVKMTLNAPVVSGQAVWGYGTAGNPTAKLTEMREGASSPGWYSVPGKPATLSVTAATGLYSYFVSDKITVEYRYKVMGK